MVTALSVPAYPDNPTADETSAIGAFEKEISCSVADSAKSVLGSTKDPKVALKLLEKRFGVMRRELQSVLMAELQLTKWDSSGTTYIHCDSMVDLRAELAVGNMGAPHRASTARGHQPVDKVSIFLQWRLSRSCVTDNNGIKLTRRWTCQTQFALPVTKLNGRQTQCE